MPYGGIVYDEHHNPVASYDYHYFCAAQYGDGTICNNEAKANSNGNYECPIHGKEALKLVTMRKPLPERLRPKQQPRAETVLEYFKGG